MITPFSSVKFLTVSVVSCILTAEAFTVETSLRTSHLLPPPTKRYPSSIRQSLFPLCAKAAAKKNKVRPSSSGFGGAAAEDCPCGSHVAYSKCCRPLHKKVSALVTATPEQVVRARYTAYAKREIDFIIQSTHPKNTNFQADIKHWRSKIDLNCYDNFELTKCEIVEEEIMEDGQTATVTFVANMIQRDSKERTAFQEKSAFEKIGGAWLYKGGEIFDPPGRENEEDGGSQDMEEDVATV